jgi:hypothetical protein
MFPANLTTQTQELKIAGRAGLHVKVIDSLPLTKTFPKDICSLYGVFFAQVDTKLLVVELPPELLNAKIQILAVYKRIVVFSLLHRLSLCSFPTARTTSL